MEPRVKTASDVMTTPSWFQTEIASPTPIKPQYNCSFILHHHRAKGTGQTKPSNLVQLYIFPASHSENPSYRTPATMSVMKSDKGDKAPAGIPTDDDTSECGDGWMGGVGG